MLGREDCLHGPPISAHMRYLAGGDRPPILPAVSGGRATASASFCDGVIQLRVLSRRSVELDGDTGGWSTPAGSVFLSVQRIWALTVAVQLEDEESASDVACQDHVSVQVNAPEESGAGLPWIGDEGSDLTRSSGL